MEKMEKKEVKLTLIALLSSLLLGALDQTIVSTALPTIVSELNGANRLSWVVTAYLISATATTPIYGKLGDLYGRKKLLTISVIIFLIGSLLCGLSINLDMLIISRFIQGVGAGGLFPLVIATISDIIPLKDRAKYQGAFGAVFGISSILGPLLGGLLTEHISWRTIFYINLPIGLYSLYLIKKNLHAEEKLTKHKIDYLGSILIAISVTSLIILTLWGGDKYDWGSRPILSLIGVSLISLLLFIFNEKKHKEPIIPLEIFKSKVVTLNIFSSFITGATLFGTLIYITIYLQVVKGFSPIISGLALLPLTLGILPSTLYVGKKVSESGKFKLYPIIGASLITISLFTLSTLNTNTSYSLIALLLFFIGFGLGTLLQLPNLVVTNVLPKNLIGVGASTVTFTRQIGATIGTALYGTILNKQMSYYLGGYNTRGKLQSFAKVEEFPEKLKLFIYNALSLSIGDIFLIGGFIAILGIIINISVPNITLTERDIPQGE